MSIDREKTIFPDLERAMYRFDDVPQDRASHDDTDMVRDQFRQHLCRNTRGHRQTQMPSPYLASHARPVYLTTAKSPERLSKKTLVF